MHDLIARVRALLTLIWPEPQGRHRRGRPRPAHGTPLVRVELWPLPEPIAMDDDDLHRHHFLRDPYTRLGGGRSVHWTERDRLGPRPRNHICRVPRTADGMIELRDLVCTATAIGVVHT